MVCSNAETEDISDSGPYEVDFGVGILNVTRKLFYLVNDSLLEFDEMFTISLLNTSLDSQRHDGTMESFTFTIQDADGKLVQTQIIDITLRQNHRS